MGFSISEFQMPFGGDGDGGNHSIPEKLPLPYWHEPTDERFVPLLAAYQVPKLIYIVTRNGIIQNPKRDYALFNATNLEFREPFTGGEWVSFFAVGFSA